MSSTGATLFTQRLEQVQRRVGTLSQLVRIDRLIEDDGPMRGARRLRLVTGGGLEVELHPDRALDLGQVTYRGVPIAWMSPTGMVAPSLAASRDREWLRSFGGGLLATCGLDAFGPPSVGESVEYPMHGRIGIVPAAIEQTTVADGELTIAGSVRQTSVLGENILLQRRWSADIGGSVLRLRDTVRNEGPEDVGHMVLYHVNLGWPLLDESARLSIPSDRVTPRDPRAEEGIDRWSDIEPPQALFREQVFGHDFESGRIAAVSIDNSGIDTMFELRFDSTRLPALHEWKLTDEGHYVLGLEPTNVNTFQGRAHATGTGIVPYLRPGESIEYSVEFHFGPSQERVRGNAHNI